MLDLDIFSFLRGTFTPQSELKKHTWLGVGGTCWGIFEPADRQDLSLFLKCYQGPCRVLGAGSNLLVSDAGVEGVVLKLQKGFSNYHFESKGFELSCSIRAEAGLLGRILAQKAQKAGLQGVEFLYTIPGTIGGAVMGNAGCYGSDMSQIVNSVTIMDRQGRLETVSNTDMKYAYRSSGLNAGLSSNVICLETQLACRPADPDAILKTMKFFSQQRQETQPVQVRTGGSTFRNPKDSKAWVLIDSVGGRGLQYGQAQFSEKHPNFLLNLGGSTSQDLWTLAEDVRKRVYDQKGIDMQWEIHQWGVFYKNS
jgi:UDP-N-acetylmuramate dehydrogenase